MKTITLANLTEATAQEVFDQVSKHLLTQNKKSKPESGVGCNYRGIENTKCAAGCLISDEEYKPEFEAKYWATLIDRGVVPKNHQYLISDLQLIHDNYEVENWEKSLKTLAKNYKLEYNTKE